MKHALLIIALIIPYAACTDDGDTGTPVGEDGGPCYGNGTCDDGLECNVTDICEPATGDPCDGVTCSGRGVCAVAAGDTALCVCDAGYHADELTCVEDTVDVCAGETCSSHGTCVDNAGTPECTCDAGYHPDGLTCVEDIVDVCAGVTCSGHGTCADNAGTPECTCDAGYYADGLDCIAVCAGVTCSGHGTCADNAGTPECTCDAGYHADGVDCVEDVCQPLVTDDFDDGDYVGWTWSTGGAVSFSSDGSGGQQVYLHRVGFTTWSVLTQDATANGAFELSTKIGLGGTCTGGLGGCVAAIELIDNDGDALNIVVGDYQMSGVSFGFNCPAPWQPSACSIQLIADAPPTSGMEQITLSRDAAGLLTLTRNGSPIGTAVSAPNFGTVASIQLRGGRSTSAGGGGYFDDVSLCGY